MQMKTPLQKICGGGGVKTLSKIETPQELRPFLIFGNELFNSENESTLKLKLYEIQIYVLKVYNYFFIISFFLIIIAIIVMFQKFARKKAIFAHQNALDEARINFSREVHDGLAQDLAALKFALKNGETEKANYFAEHAFNESRYLIEDLQINLSDDFIENVKSILSSFELNFSIQSEFLCASEKVQKISQKYKHSLLRILSECLSNVARHSKATMVKVKITDLSDGFRFIISDNGGKDDFDASTKLSNRRLNYQDNCGFNHQENQKHHFGLENIKNRAKEMNGEANVNFENEDGGTTVAVTIKDSIR